MKRTLLAILSAALMTVSCADRYVTENIENLFRPSATSTPVVNGNTVSYSWYGIADAVGYRFQMSLSADFEETVVDEELKIPKIKVEKLSYNTIYYARVKALAYKSEFDSKWNSLERITTAARIVPTVLYEVLDDEIGATSAILRWDRTYYATRIVVTGMGSSDFKAEITLEDADRQEGCVTVEGLSASSSYQAVIYDDTIEFEEERSFNVVTFKTTKYIPGDGREGGKLLSIGDDLKAAIDQAEDGQTLILPRGYSYATSTTDIITIDKNLCILAARQGEFALEDGADDCRPFISVAVVSKAAQIPQMPFHIEGELEQVRFEGIDFQATATGKNCVPFYLDGKLSLDYLIIENCSFRDLGSGVLMTDSAESQTIDNVIFRDNLVDNCATNTGFRFFTLCSSKLSIADFNIERCTLAFSKFGLFTNLYQYSINGGTFPGNISITLKQCNTASLFCSRNGGTNGTKLFDMAGSNGVVIKMDRCLFTRNGNAAGTNFYSLGTESSVTATNCLYTAGDFSIVQAGGAIATGIFPLEGKQAKDVFSDYENNDYTITDPSITAAGVGCSQDWSWIPVVK